MNETMTILDQLEQSQPQIVTRFKKIIENNELAHAYLFAGPSGAGKFQLAQWIAMRLFCLHVENNQPDETCEECQRILSGNHPDIVEVEPDGRQIKVDQVRYLKSEFSKSAVEGSIKIFMIKQADKMTVNAANSLLKFLEEPEGDFIAFLMTANKSSILPTIQSRSQSVEFLPISKTRLIELLQKDGITKSQSQFASGLTNSIDQIKLWLEDDWLDNAQKAVIDWYVLLGNHDLQSFIAVQKEMMPLAKQRDRQQTMLDMIMLIWRDTIIEANQRDTGEISYQAATAQIEQVVGKTATKKITNIAQLTLELRRKLDQNISFQNIVEQLTIKILDTLRG
ncbi:DNA polymerase III subunit delta' [Paucilactobacillus nenjiangensis]|uniref:DNA polymerase III subunit delta' n=1 Tax=Paucilactobacillus nenjiangensis TaxID=1296540 RepID=UPI001CDBC461|nr:DNA polymerase III subunit delta' [Paucilactobacillus nenjiangensis]